MRIAYADPPYVGQARKHYAHDPRCAEVDHGALFALLADYDGWALSCSSPSLAALLPIAPEGARVAAWVKPFASFKRGVSPAYAWEPVIFKPARGWSREKQTVRDWHSANIRRVSMLGAALRWIRRAACPWRRPMTPRRETCRWEEFKADDTSTVTFLVCTECNRAHHSRQSGWTYCPHCGGRIVREEGK